MTNYPGNHPEMRNTAYTIWLLSNLTDFFQHNCCASFSSKKAKATRTFELDVRTICGDQHIRTLVGSCEHERPTTHAWLKTLAKHAT